MFQEEICSGREVSSRVSPVPRRDGPAAAAPPGLQPSCSARPCSWLLCELLGSLLLWGFIRNKPWCSEGLGTISRSAWAAVVQGLVPCPLACCSCSWMQSAPQWMWCGVWNFFFSNLKQLVKTLKQWIDAHWKLFSSCLESQKQSYWTSFQECAFKVKNVQSFSISQ